MNLRTPTVLTASTMVLVTALPSFAVSYCTALLDEAQLALKYQRLAPIFGDTETGWIFTSDQMDEDYVMKAESEQLMTQIVTAITERDVSLAIMVAPPRPVVAGQTVVDATLGQNHQFDVRAASDSFQKMTDQLRATGAAVPDLIAVATAIETTEPFYFKRDTHWTNTGAAESALAMARVVNPGEAPAFLLAEIAAGELYSEEGSLGQIVEATCKLQNPTEETPTFDYSNETDGLGLLDDNTLEVVALLGTSFSDRNKRDQHQVADALSAALLMDVHNLSVSGGGLIGPIEAYVLSGALDERQHPMLIWEFPYTQSLNSTSELRQLLGALRSGHFDDNATIAVKFLNENQSITVFAEGPRPADLLHIVTDNRDVVELDVEITFESGKTKKFELRRKNRIPQERRSDDWWVDLSRMDYGGIVSIGLAFGKNESVGDVFLALHEGNGG